MDPSREKSHATRDIFSTGRRSAISTSEFGLYSDYSDHYKFDTYGNTIRKFVIGVMVVVSVILIGIFLYDFASSASVSSKASQETKHIYVLQNSLRKGLAVTKRPNATLPPSVYIVNTSRETLFEDRSDDARKVEFETALPDNETREQRMATDEHDLVESRAQNLENFKHRGGLVKRLHEQSDVFDNHAIDYRVNRLKVPSGMVDEDSSDEETHRGIPFRFELKGPHPASFKRLKYPQLGQYRYHPHATRNIQDVIKYLVSDPDTLNRGFKFTGFYVNPKKYDSGHPDIGVVAMNGDRSEEQESAAYAVGADPLYQYKPKHPTDVNLLATSNFRFSPLEVQRYNSYYNKYYQRPGPAKPLYPVHHENQYENTVAYNPPVVYNKKKKPKPFSVMLDIYPITEGLDQSQKAPRSKQQVMMDEPDSRRPFDPYNMATRHPKLYGLQVPTPYVAHQPSEDDDKHQMILHLNLYPKKKNKQTRNEIINRSQSGPPESENERIFNRMIIPLDAIAKHLEDQAMDSRDSESSSLRYEETLLAKEEVELTDEFQADKFVATATSAEDAASTTNIPESDGGKNSTMATVEDLTTTTSTETIIIVEDTTPRKMDSPDIDTIEGFQQFADSLIATD